VQIVEDDLAPLEADFDIGSNDLLIATQGTLSGIASELLGMEELRNGSAMMSGWDIHCDLGEPMSP
jgi:hypothetical protein